MASTRLVVALSIVVLALVGCAPTARIVNPTPRPAAVPLFQPATMALFIRSLKKTAEGRPMPPDRVYHTELREQLAASGLFTEVFANSLARSGTGEPAEMRIEVEERLRGYGIEDAASVVILGAFSRISFEYHATIRATLHLPDGRSFDFETTSIGQAERQAYGSKDVDIATHEKAAKSAVRSFVAQIRGDERLVEALGLGGRRE